jgi:hypothetical protein
MSESPKKCGGEFAMRRLPEKTARGAAARCDRASLCGDGAWVSVTEFLAAGRLLLRRSAKSTAARAI